MDGEGMREGMRDNGRPRQWKRTIGERAREKHVGSGGKGWATFSVEAERAESISHRIAEDVEANGWTDTTGALALP